MIEVVGGVKLGMVGHVGFAEEGRGADEGIGGDFRYEGCVEGRVSARFGLDGDGIGATEGLEVDWGLGGGGGHGCRRLDWAFW